MREKSLKKVFCKLTAAVMCISLLTPAVPLQAANDAAERDAVEAAPVLGTEASRQYDSIDGLSGDILYDTAGNRVKACGGEVHQFTENGETKWYWFGVDDLEKAEGEEKDEGIHLYSSTDLYNWDYEGKIWNLKDAAHPKVLYNEQTQKYVMWVSTIQEVVGETSSSIKGPVTEVREYTSDPSEGTITMFGFINLYEEKQGEAYIFYNSSIAKLTADYTDIECTKEKTESRKEIPNQGQIAQRYSKL